MARQARTKSVLSQLSGNTKLEVGSAKVNHAIKKHVSSMVGTDIMAGEATLSNAFNNFFGTMQNTMQNMAKSAHEIDKIEATRFAEEQKNQGTIAGNQKAMESTLTTEYDATGAVTQMSKSDRLKNFKESETQSTNLHYNKAYKESLGTQLGADMYADMLIKSADWRPADFDTNAKKWWDSKYANGSSDATVNLHAQAAFQKNIVKLSAEKKVQVIKENRTKIETTIVDGMVKTFESGGGGDLVLNYYNAITKMKSIMPGQSDGAVSSRVLSAMVKGAKVSPDASQRLAVFLDKAFLPTGDASGVEDTLQSLRQKFPSQISQLLVDVNAANQKHMTQEGSTAVTETLSDLSTIATTFKHNPSGMGEALATWYKDKFVGLSATVGVTSPQVQKVKAEFTKLYLENASFSKMQNQLLNNAKTGDAGDLTATNAKEVLGKMSFDEVYDFTSDTIKATKFGTIIRGAVDRYGISVIDDTLKAKIKAGLVSTDTTIMDRTIKLLKLIDSTPDLSQIKEDLFKDDKVISPRIAGILAGESGIVSGTQTEIEFQNAHKAIEETGLLNMIFAESVEKGEKNTGSNPKRTAKYNEWLKSSVVGEIFDEIVLGDTWGTPDMSLSLITRMKTMMNQSVADLMVGGKWTNDDSDNQENLVKSIATKLKSKVVYYNETLHYMPDMEFKLDKNQFGMIPIGNAVPNGNPNGETEDVFKNMEAASKTITEGFPTLQITDGGSLMIRPHSYFKLPATYTDAKNVKRKGNLTVYGIFDSMNPGTPLGLKVGEDLKVEQVSKYADGKYDGGFSWYENQPNSQIKLTGDYKSDLLLAKKYLNPYIVLAPFGEKNSDGKYSGYHLGVVPHFTETKKSTISNNALQQLLEELE